MNRTLKILLGIVIYPYGIYLLIRYFTKKPSKNRLEPVNQDNKELNKSIDSKYFIPKLDTKSDEILSNIIDKEVLIPLFELFSTSHKNRKLNNGFGVQYFNNWQHKSFSTQIVRDLILTNEKIIVKTNDNRFGKHLKLMGVNHVELVYDNITSIKFKEGSGGNLGYIKFVFPGQIEEKMPETLFGENLVNNKSDPYLVYFSTELNHLMREVQNVINRKITKYKHSNKENVKDIDYTLQLEKIFELKEKGVITEEEFLNKKKTLLKKI